MLSAVADVDALSSAPSELIDDIEGREAEKLQSLEVPYCLHAGDISEGIERILRMEVSEEAHDDTLLEREVMKVSKCIDLYLEQPTLLDPHLSQWILPLVERIKSLLDHGLASPMMLACCKIIYMIAKVRGRKSVMPFLPSSVACLIPICRATLCLLQSSEVGIEWFIRRSVLLLFATVVIRIPFDLVKLKEMHLIDSLFETVWSLLKRSGAESDAAATFLATFLSRPDQGHRLLGILVELKDILSDPSSNIQGSLHLLTRIAKLLPLDQLAPHKDILKQIIDSLRPIPGARKALIKVSSQLQPLIDPTASTTLELLYVALSDRDSTLRWTTAKKLSLIAAKNGMVPSVAAHLLSTIKMQLDSPFPDPNCIHGHTLCVSQMVAKMDEHLLSQTVELLPSLLTFEIPKGRFSAGSAVRDAACLTIWTMVRSHPRPRPLLRNDSPSSQNTSLPMTLVCSSLFDREVTCRRAAAAALQEMVGRWADYVPDGIHLLPLINFFNASQRSLTFASLPLEITENFPMYRLPMIDHLLKHSIYHWDVGIRRLAAPLLASLSHLEEVTLSMIDALIDAAQCPDDINVQHGAILTLAHLAKDDHLIDGRLGDVSLCLSGVSPKILGWDMLASAVLLLVANLANNPQVTVDSHHLEGWLSLIKSALSSKDDSLHEIASYQVLPAISRREGPQSQLMSEFFRGLVLPAADKDRNIHAQRGFSLAIGAFPTWLFKDRYGPLNKLLTKMITITEHIEKKVNLIKSSTRLYLAADGEGDGGMEVDRDLMSALVGCLSDYSIDSRGDIGSKVRSAAMASLQSLLSPLTDTSTANAMMDAFVCALLRHSFDKLDRLRTQAIVILSQVEKSRWQLWYHTCCSPGEFFCDDLLSFALSERSTSQINAILTGLVSSAGCISPLIAKPAFDLIKSALVKELVDPRQLLDVLEATISEPHMAKAVINVTDALLSEGVLSADNLVQKSSLVSYLQDRLTEGKRNMHDLLTIARILKTVSHADPILAEWISQQATSHPYPKIREVLLSNNSSNSSSDVNN